MAETTGISWADATFNPWVGCEKVSPGCAHCYAETLVTGRMGRPGTWGPDGVRERTSVSNWRKPILWNQRAEREGLRLRVFCASLADVFEPRPEVAPWRDELFRLIEQTPALDWLVLTKRPDYAAGWLAGYYDRWSDDSGDPPLSALFLSREWHGRDNLGWGVLPNLWIGTSIENAAFTDRADWLRLIPAPVRFLSCEPLVGSLFPKPAAGHPRDSLDRGGPAAENRDLPGTPGEVTDRPVAQGDPPGLVTPHARGGTAHGSPVEREAPGVPRPRAPLDLTGIDWVIIGGESGGPSARPMHPDWAREIRDACLNYVLDRTEYGVCPACGRLTGAGSFCDCKTREKMRAWGERPALHFKQWGSWTPDGATVRDPHVTHAGRLLTTNDLDRFSWPEGAAAVRYAGAHNKSGGKLLDGVDWCEIPDPALTPA